MYYNFGQSLRANSQFDEAAQAAFARRKLWNGNAERLLGVAVELAELDSVMHSQTTGATNNGAANELHEDVLATLQQAYDSGWPRTVDLKTETKFASFNKDKRFVAKIAELNERSTQPDKRAGQRSEGSQPKTN
jgi:hypothetical protein